MSEYIYRKLSDQINKGIYSVNEIYIRQRSVPFNPELYDEKVSQQLIEMMASNNLENLSIMLERKPNPNTTDVLGKSLLDYLMDHKKYSEAIRLIKMGAIPTQKIMISCLMSSLRDINNKSYCLELSKTLIDYGLKPLSKEQLFGILNYFNNLNYKIEIFKKKYNINENTKYNILLAYEKKLKMMYENYLLS